MSFLIVDVLGCGKGRRLATLDVIGSGPRIIAGVLEKHGLNVKVIHYSKLMSNPDILREFEFLLVSAMSVDFPAVRRVKSLWDKFSRGLAVIGGPITSDPYDAIIRAGFPIAVIGEGEETLEELIPRIMDGRLSQNSLSKIRGIAFSVNNGFQVNSLRPVLSRDKLNSYFPSIEAVKEYPSFFACRVYVEVVRGCSNYYRTTLSLPDGRKCIGCDLCRSGDLEERYNCPVGIPPGCGYCSVPSLFGPPRSRSIDLIVREIDELIKIGVKRIVLSGSDFLDYGRDLLVEPKPLTDPRNPPPNIDVIEELLSSIKSVIDGAGHKVFIGIENVKPCLVSDEVACILGKYLRNSPVHIGCETGSIRHAYELGRPSSPDEVVRAAKILKRYGLRPYLYFIHGLPGQSLETAKATVRMMEKAASIGVEKITVYRFQPLPMSAFGDFSKAPPAYRDPVSFMIWDAARKINEDLKKRLIGRIVDAIIVRSTSKRASFIAYPFEHGPVIYVNIPEGLGGRLIGKIVKVRIIRVISDRVVEGVILG